MDILTMTSKNIILVFFKLYNRCLDSGANLILFWVQQKRGIITGKGLMLGFSKIKLLITRVVLNPGSVELAQSQLSFKDNLKIKSKPPKYFYYKYWDKYINSLICWLRVGRIYLNDDSLTWSQWKRFVIDTKYNGAKYNGAKYNGAKYKGAAGNSAK